MNPAYLVTIVLLLVHLCSFTPISLAQSERGHKGAIDKKTMLSIFEAGRDDPEKGWVDGYVVAGNDVVQIIRDTDLPIKIRNSIINGGLDFTNLHLESVSDLQKPENWEKDIWAKLLESIDYCKLAYSVTNLVDISNCVIHGFLGIQIDNNSNYYFTTIFYKPISFHGTTFDGTVNFGISIFNRNTNFSSSTFNSHIKLRSAIFNNSVNFRNSTFITSEFYGCEFKGDSCFTGAVFRRDTGFQAAKFASEVSFKETTFNGNADFQYARFQGNANFRQSTFNNADFWKAVFNENADFSKSVFNKAIYFRQSLFLKTFTIDSIRSLEFLSLRNAEINRFRFYNPTRPVIIESRLDLRRSKINEAHLEDIVFENDVDFSGSTINSIILRFINFESNAFFLRTEFQNAFCLDHVNFIKLANFTGSIFNHMTSQNQKCFSLSHLSFNGLILNWNQFPNTGCWLRPPDPTILGFADSEEPIYYKLEPLQSLSQVLKDLEAIFKKSNQLEDANEAYFYRKQAELQEASTKPPGEKLLSQLEWLSWGIWTGYGVRIWRVIFLCALVDLFFALLYFAGKPQRKYEESGQRDFTFKQRFLEFPRKYLTRSPKSWTSNQNLIRFANSVRLSSVILFKFGYRDTTISGKIAGIDYKYIIWTEWLFGFVLLGFLAVTLSNTLPILHKLVSAVF